MQEFWSLSTIRGELNRLTQLHDLGFWSDAPPKRELKGKTTAVRGTPTPRPPERRSIPHPPIPDDYLAAMGPRVLWLIKDMGPNLIHLLETLSTMLVSGNAASYTIGRRVSRYFEANVWRDHNGQVIDKPPFILQHGSCRGKHNRKKPGKHDPLEWPPNNWSSVQALAVSLADRALRT